MSEQRGYLYSGSPISVPVSRRTGPTRTIRGLEDMLGAHVFTPPNDTLTHGELSPIREKTEERKEEQFYPQTPVLPPILKKKNEEDVNAQGNLPNNQFYPNANFNNSNVNSNVANNFTTATNFNNNNQIVNNNNISNNNISTMMGSGIVAKKPVQALPPPLVPQKKPKAKRAKSTKDKDRDRDVENGGVAAGGFERMRVWSGSLLPSLSLVELIVTFAQFLVIMTAIPVPWPHFWTEWMRLLNYVTWDVRFRPIGMDQLDFRAHFVIIAVLLPMAIACALLLALMRPIVVAWLVTLIASIACLIGAFIVEVMPQNAFTQDAPLHGIVGAGAVGVVFCFVAFFVHRSREKKELRRIKLANPGRTDIDYLRFQERQRSARSMPSVLSIIVSILIIAALTITGLFCLEIIRVNKSYVAQLRGPLQSLAYGLGRILLFLAGFLFIRFLVRLSQRGRDLVADLSAPIRRYFVQLLIFFINIAFLPIVNTAFQTFTCVTKTCDAGTMFPDTAILPTNLQDRVNPFVPYSGQLNSPVLRDLQGATISESGGTPNVTFYGYNGTAIFNSTATFLLSNSQCEICPFESGCARFVGLCQSETSSRLLAQPSLSCSEDIFPYYTPVGFVIAMLFALLLPIAYCFIISVATRVLAKHRIPTVTKVDEFAILKGKPILPSTVSAAANNPSSSALQVEGANPRSLAAQEARKRYATMDDKAKRKELLFLYGEDWCVKTSVSHGSSKYIFAPYEYTHRFHVIFFFFIKVLVVIFALGQLTPLKAIGLHLAIHLIVAVYHIIGRPYIGDIEDLFSWGLPGTLAVIAACGLGYEKTHTLVRTYPMIVAIVLGSALFVFSLAVGIFVHFRNLKRAKLLCAKFGPEYRGKTIADHIYVLKVSVIPQLRWIYSHFRGSARMNIVKESVLEKNQRHAKVREDFGEKYDKNVPITDEKQLRYNDIITKGNVFDRHEELVVDPVAMQQKKELAQQVKPADQHLKIGGVELMQQQLLEKMSKENEATRKAVEEPRPVMPWNEHKDLLGTEGKAKFGQMDPDPMRVSLLSGHVRAYTTIQRYVKGFLTRRSLSISHSLQVMDIRLEKYTVIILMFFVAATMIVTAMCLILIVVGILNASVNSKLIPQNALRSNDVSNHVPADQDINLSTGGFSNYIEFHEFAGYANWANFTKFCCCSDIDFQTNIHGFNESRTELWSCANGYRKIKSRIVERDGANVTGIPLRGFCALKFNKGVCTEPYFESSGTTVDGYNFYTQGICDAKAYTGDTPDPFALKRLW